MCRVARISSSPDRRAPLLDAAFATFVRFGYRKTSMDDVAREAGMSRQALYGYFSDKESLFRDCMKHGLEAAMAEVDAALANSELAIEVRLVRAFDEWLGRLLERRGTDGSDLGEAARALLGTLFADFGAIFEGKLARAITASPLAAACKEAKATPQQIAETLHACALGWKHRARSRAEFVERVEVAVRLLVAKPRSR
jgi:TetR/AcrR family transcriptional regulator, regulator of autoinduction and epiphytic fitness